ncbi:MAG: Gfo/Idh/MocA family oxidoreductase [Candidatus Hydrogenedentes bacterium]|nr:Gfo/Idh/MocA family oxidoreductase [Candidatus Hydrogenedentota bacterium]
MTTTPSTEHDAAALGFAPLGDKPLSLAMVGMVEGNGHPYSWSAIFNGYDAVAMAQSPYPAIPDYLGRQPKGTLGIPGARVTHIWTDDAADAAAVARASLIPNLAEAPEEVIGQVDAVIIATDIGHEHVTRCRPFVEAGVPVFVDKPLVDNARDLAQFRAWHEAGRAILSSSCMAYAKEFLPWRESTHDLGALRFAAITTMKSWERYGIHALSAIYPLFGPGFLHARHCGTPAHNVVVFTHACGAEAVVAAVDDMYGGFGKLLLCGTRGSAQAEFSDTFYAFKAQLLDFVDFLRTGRRHTSFSETEELMRMLIAGIRSREEGGRTVALEEI